MWPSHDVRDPRELEAALEDGPGEILTDGPLGPRVLDVPEVIAEHDDEPLEPVVIHVPDAAAAGAPDVVAEESTDPISLHDAGTPCLVMATAEGRERCFPLGALNILVGRSKSADIVVDGEGVALFHVRIEPTGDGRHRVIDLDARSGTLLNGEPIEYAALVPGDVLTLGDTEL
ncbi:MAG: FHA domain-containing protein, partial [Myxococcales bacterium]|nr:FHA domain-containing protein [Myxococcales bacterium]